MKIKKKFIFNSIIIENNTSAVINRVLINVDKEDDVVYKL